MWRLVLVLAVACSSSSSPKPLCTVPAQTTYSCQPLTGSAGSDECIGGPAWTPENAPVDARHQDDPTAIFPARCEANIPDCSPYYIGMTRLFICENGVWSEQL